ncbi:MAG TPA: methyltransferase domain-containing protein [Actinomycetota bacterium]|nr:methyltransferase domain-containing protein [Actinomycetota bacterium]
MTKVTEPPPGPCRTLYGSCVPRDWDAATYDRVANPQFRWGAAVIDRLELSGGETVLDAGCGSGRVTEVLLERLPNGRVVALDGSGSMLEQARVRLERFGDRVGFVLADLGEPLPLEEPVDAILSTATFHWVPDHDALFRNLAAVVRPGGRLAAQCGGSGNLATVMAALRELGADPFSRKVFTTPEQTEERLHAAGFVDARCWLHNEPTPFDDPEALEAFLRTVALGDHVAAMSEPEARAFAYEVAVRLPSTSLDYVRLNIRARRAS